MKQTTLTLNVLSDLDLIPAGEPCQRVLEIVVQAPDAERLENRPGLNLALVLDRSGSMQGEKLSYVKQAALHVIEQMDRQDRLALVVFDDQVELLAGSTLMAEADREGLKSKVRQIEAGNTTNLSGGWLQGCEAVASAVQPGQLNRVLLLTDGLANVGITDEEILGTHARELAARGVSTSTFGVGHGFNEHLLDTVSSQGGGNFYFIAEPREIPSIFGREFRELSTVTAGGVEIDIDLPAQVSATVLGGWRTEESPSHLKIFLGDLYQGRQLPVYIRLLLPPSSGRSEMPVQVHARATGVEGRTFEPSASFTYRYADIETVKKASPVRAVLERFAKVDVSEATNEALRMERKGDRKGAKMAVLHSLDMNRDYLDQRSANEIQEMADRMEHGMDEADRKASHYQSALTRKGRGS